MHYRDGPITLFHWFWIEKITWCKQPLNEKNNMNQRIKHGLIKVHLLPIKFKDEDKQ